MSKHEGGCLCGAVRFSFDVTPAMVAACHCTDCRRQSGSAYSMNVGVPTAALNLSGKPKVFEHPGGSGQTVHRHFCGDCGSPIASEIDVMPGMSFVKAGTLDDPSWVKPGVEVWCDSKLAWSTLSGDWPRVAQNPR